MAAHVARHHHILLIAEQIGLVQRQALLQLLAVDAGDGGGKLIRLGLITGCSHNRWPQHAPGPGTAGIGQLQRFFSHDRRNTSPHQGQQKTKVTPAKHRRHKVRVNHGSLSSQNWRATTATQCMDGWL